MGAAAGRLENIRHRVWRARIDRDVGAGSSGKRKFVWSNIERRNVQPHRLSILDMPEAADAGDGDPFTRPRLGFLKALVAGDAGTKDRRNLRKIDADRKPRGKRRRSDHIFSETAITAIAGVMLVLAHGLPTGLAIFATHTGIVQPRNADGVAWLEIRDARAKRSHNAGK